MANQISQLNCLIIVFIENVIPVIVYLTMYICCFNGKKFTLQVCAGIQLISVTHSNNKNEIIWTQKCGLLLQSMLCIYLYSLDHLLSQDVSMSTLQYVKDFSWGKK